METVPASLRTFVRDTVAVLVLLGFLAGFYVFLQKTRDENASPLVTIDSPFTGDAEQSAERLILAGKEAGRSITVTPIALKKNARYILTVEASGNPELHVDFWGPNYDNKEQEVWISRGPKSGVQGFILNSGDAPAQGTLLRIFKEGKEPIIIKSLFLREQPGVPRSLVMLLLLSGGLIGGVYAVRHQKISWVAAAGLGILATGAYFCVRIPQSANVGDNFWYVPTTVSLLSEGNLELSEYTKWFGQPPTDARITQVGNRYYNLFPFGTSILSAPMVLLGERLAGNRSEPFRTLFLASFSAKLLAGLAVSLMYLVLLQLTGRRSVSIVLTLCFAFCTSHFSLHAGGLWSHNGGSFILCTVLFLLVCGEGRLAPFVAPLLVFGYAVRPDLAISAIVITGYVWWRHRRSFPLFTFLMAVSIIAFAGYCYASFGTPLPPYYSAGGMTGGHFGEALVGNLVSPNRGLFVFTPIALFSVLGIYLALARRRSLYVSLSMILFLHWLSISMFGHWWAGYSYGPRFFALVTPLLIVLLVPVWEEVLRMSARARVAVLALFFVATSWSFLVHLRGATSLETQHWNAQPSVDEHPERIWDWRDWQPLAGLR